jgi:hypothetical protein
MAHHLPSKAVLCFEGMLDAFGVSSSVVEIWCQQLLGNLVPAVTCDLMKAWSMDSPTVLHEYCSRCTCAALVKVTGDVR